MTRRRGLVGGAVLATALTTGLATVLSGCAPAPEVDPEAVQQWMTTQNAVEVPGSLATLGGQASPLSDVVGEGGVTVSFAEPHAVTSILFACFGPEAMSVDIAMTGSAAGGSVSAQVIRTDDLVCDGEQQRIDMAMDVTTEVTAGGLTPDVGGAWAVHVIGED